MKSHIPRLKLAAKAAVIHFFAGLAIAIILGILIFVIWYPYPYNELAGGKELFILVMSIDIICGPILTFVIFSPTKSKNETLVDISAIVIIQLAALSYGIWNVWQVKPLFLVQEADRFNIISKANIDTNDFNFLPKELRPKIFDRPIKVSIRQTSSSELEKINTQIKSGGKDASELPFLYSHFQADKAYSNAHDLRELLITQPQHTSRIKQLMAISNSDEKNRMRYLYLVGRYYWIVVIDQSGSFREYLEIK